LNNGVNRNFCLRVEFPAFYDIQQASEKFSKMKTIGLLGGMSWESSAEYYRITNEETKSRLGGHNNARSLLLTLNFHDIRELQQRAAWDDLARILQDAARQLEAAGADFIVLCTNTMHKVATEIEAAVSIPLLHIADPTAEEVRARGFQTVGLLGTKFTMEEAFYRERLENKHHLNVIIPEPADRAIVHDVIFEELCHGRIVEQSRLQFGRIIEDLKGRGAQAVILGCTELGPLVRPQDSCVPVFDTTELHARAAVKLAAL
jgi:aspartate racemase